MYRNCASFILFCAVFSLIDSAGIAVTIQWSTVGNPSNAPDSADGDSATAGVQHLGNVDHTFRIGTYDITNSQYAEFLNIKDPTGKNALRLWNANFADAQYGGIAFNDSKPPGGKYVLVDGRQNHPVNYVGYFNALRFINWLNNGQANGDTESGAYTLLGGLAQPSNFLTITRNPGATVFLPNQNEWYKAAFYNPVTSSYFLFATSSNANPMSGPPSAAPNRANFSGFAPTDVGAYSGTISPYGAFDMNGNVFQWNEGVGVDSTGNYWRLRGGAFDQVGSGQLRSDYVMDVRGGTLSLRSIGFRVASTVPEPSTLALAALGALGLLIAARRKR